MAKGDIISRLKLESGEFDSKIKRAGQELLAYSEHCKKMGLEMGYANRDAKEFAKQLGSMATVSTTARGKINELSEAFINAKVMYKNMTDEEKKGEFGRNLADSLDQLKVRLNDAKKDLADVTKELNGGGGKFGEFGNVLDTLGSKLGVTGNLTELLTSKTALLTGAVGAGIAVVTKSAEAWASYNAELAKQDQVTQVTTGLKGEDADRMTDKMRALSDTYKVDFREAVNAANTLMTQFGKTGDEATQLIKDGMRGMIQGDGPKLLSMIQQYAPAFRDAGVSASQLVAVIQNSEGGIFTDQNMNAIVMGIKNIRLMTDATSQSLAKMGIDGKKMSEQLNNGTLTVFDALKQVAAQLQTVDSNSKTAGEVMQQVFGRQGVTAGTNLAKAIETLNTDLEQTKVQTGEVGDAMADLQDANERLNTAIRDAFGYDGWDTMATGIKTKLVSALADVIDHLAIIEEGFGKLFGKGKKPEPKPDTYDNPNGNKYGSYQVTTDSDGNVIKATKWHHGKAIDMTDYERTQQGVVVTGRLNRNKTGGGGGKVTTPKPEDTNYAADSIMAQEKLVAKLTDQYKRAGAAVKDGIKKQLDEATRKLAEMQGNGVEVFKTGSLPQLTQQLKELQTAQQKSLNNGEWRKYQEQIDETTEKINILKGNLPKGQQAVFDIKVNAEQLEQLRMFKPDDATIHVNVEEGTVDLPDVPADNKTIHVSIVADTAEAMQQLQDLTDGYEGKEIHIQTRVDEPKTPKDPTKTAGEELELSIRTKLADDAIAADEQTLRTLLETKIKNNLDGIAIPIDNILADIQGDGIPDEYWEKLQAQINEELAKIHVDPIQIDFATGKVKQQSKEMEKDWRSAAGAIQAVGSAMSAIEDPATKVVGTVAQAVATMALSYAQASSAAAQNPANAGWGWIAFAATGLATMLTSIEAIKSASHFAQGGIVGGNDFTDNTPVMVSSGELILNRSQQDAIASQLNDGGNPLQNMRLTATISGEQIRLALNNNGRRTGKGEYVQTNFR